MINDRGGGWPIEGGKNNNKYNKKGKTIWPKVIFEYQGGNWEINKNRQWGKGGAMMEKF
jgi:hypothetical protein